MAKTNALSILSGEAPATLGELYVGVIENLQKMALSLQLKSQAYTGDPKTGSAVFKRFANSESKEYGTARAAGKGDKINALDVPVNLDQHKEIVEEIAKFDMETFGVVDIMHRRALNHPLSMATTLDREFFRVAAEEGVVFTPADGVTETRDVIESMIVTLEEIKNQYVDGVDRELMELTLAPTVHSALQKYLDELGDKTADSTQIVKLFHNVKVHSSTRLPLGTKAVLMINGAVAQPVVTYVYSEPEKIPMSNDYASSLFYDYGTKALTPDLILVWKE